ncbi:hypothetical protein [Deinococcus pimensis]|uniref:hypothetical protein n=1 Tax=Deinococcus pimensis TaxID=309888 RepID=UPI00048531FE|nr:hypothetical protein [Deinococcus pimensis]
MLTDVALVADVDIRGNGHALTAEQAQDWVGAVVLGCREALDYARSEGVVQDCFVQVTRVEGLYVDTLEQDLQVTAFMAVWDTLTKGARPLSLKFEGGRWLFDPI